MTKLFQLLCFPIITLLALCRGQELSNTSIQNQGIQFPLMRSLDTLEDTAIPVNTTGHYSYLNVYADLAAACRQQQNLSDNTAIEMEISISASQSGLNAADSTCEKFISGRYKCESPLCTEITPSSGTIYYPGFSSTNVTTLNLESPGLISLANGSWQLNTQNLLYTRVSIVSLVGLVGLG